eukprot:CFRG0781T1
MATGNLPSAGSSGMPSTDGHSLSSQSHTTPSTKVFLEDGKYHSNCLVVESPHELSRFLYSNPVVILTSYRKDTDKLNAMVLSWLTPINNQAEFVMSISNKRFTSKQLEHTDYFVLNVPVEGMESIVLQIGGCSGRDVEDKLLTLGVKVCRPGWGDLDGLRGDGKVVVSARTQTPPSASVQHLCEESDKSKEVEGTVTSNVLHINNSQPTLCMATHDQSSQCLRGTDNKNMWTSEVLNKKDRKAKKRKERDEAAGATISVSQCVAHLVCLKRRQLSADDQHTLFICEIIKAFVRPAYWQNGKQFVTDGISPPHLCFLGSRRFANVVPP